VKKLTPWPPLFEKKRGGIIVMGIESMKKTSRFILRLSAFAVKKSMKAI
jgi:hypothetical protein